MIFPTLATFDTGLRPIKLPWDRALRLDATDYEENGENGDGIEKIGITRAESVSSLLLRYERVVFNFARIGTRWNVGGKTGGEREHTTRIESDSSRCDAHPIRRKHKVRTCCVNAGLGLLVCGLVYWAGFSFG